jgi:hypothetical protein
VEVRGANVRLGNVETSECGHLGGSFFERYRTVYFDLPHGRILLKD